jgi:hypothetical protein
VAAGVAGVLALNATFFAGVEIAAVLFRALTAAQHSA